MEKYLQVYEVGILQKYLNYYLNNNLDFYEIGYISAL